MLPMILALGFIILVVVLAMSTTSFVEVNMGSSQKKADEAFFISNAGISDAFMKISRNKSYSSAGYELGLGNGTTTVVVELDTPSSGKSRITSTGVVSNTTRKIQSVVSIDTNGKVTTDSWAEITP